MAFFDLHTAILYGRRGAFKIMPLTLDEDQSFSLSAYVTSPGYQSVALSGYIVGHWGGETYIAPLRPDMFYGVTGAQLGHTWRQWFENAGEQVVLSRGSDSPHIPHDPAQVAWRKVRAAAPAAPTPAPTRVQPTALPVSSILLIAGTALLGGVLVTLWLRG